MFAIVFYCWKSFPNLRCCDVGVRLVDAEGKLGVERALANLIKEAIRAFHRRLLVVFGREALDVIAYVILRHYVLKGGGDEKVVFVDWGEDETAYNKLIEKLGEEAYPIGNVRHYTYEDTHRIMGTTNDILILDMGKGARPNDIGRLIETVKGGGLAILYNLDLKAEKPWNTSVHRKLASPPYAESDLKNRFERFFVRKLENPSVWILEGWRIVKGKLLNPSRAKREKSAPPRKSKIPEQIFRLALTREQMEALRTFELLAGKKRGIIVFISDRGRGKSALLGLGAAALLALGHERIIVTAPHARKSKRFSRWLRGDSHL
jgi:tRNA(Met) C34 N-acetyltransferase TmcA